MDSDVIQREKDFHEQRFGQDEGRRREDGLYRALHDMKCDFNASVIAAARDGHVLDFGCGTGDATLSVASAVPVKSITGIDISENAVKIAAGRAVSRQKQIDYQVANCEATGFADHRFDAVYGSGILHHLDMSRALKELRRITAPTGAAIFYEPLGTNPLINLYRLLTPGSRSPDEHPLMPADLRLIRAEFPHAEFRYYGFFTLMCLPVMKDPGTSTLYRLASGLDRLVLRGPLRWLAWSVLFVGRRQAA
jgi:SAM-dependent methyltransferase